MNLDCTICGATSETEIGGIPVCLDCFHSIQESEYDFIKLKVLKFKKKGTGYKASNESGLTLDEIESHVCSFYNIDPSIIQKKSRDKNVIKYRQICHHISAINYVDSLAVIGRRFGRKDHATVSNSKKSIDNLIETNKSFRKEYEELLSKF